MITRILTVICCCFLLTACSPESEQQQTVDLQLGVMPSMDYLPLAVAEREGYFNQVGLNIVLQPFYSANDRDAALQGNVVDGVVIDYSGVILQAAKGTNLRLTSACNGEFYLVAGKNSQIKTLADIQGKSVAISHNTVIDYFIDMALAFVQLTPDDITKVEINKIPVRFELLQNSKVDAAGLPNVIGMVAEDNGATVLTSNTDLGLSITGIVFTGKALKEKKDQIKKMYQAYNMGVDYLQSHPASDIKDILTKSFGVPDHLINNIPISQYTKAALPDERSLQLVTQWLIKKKLINSDFNPNSILDGSYLP